MDVLLFDKYQQLKNKGPRHEQSAKVDEIVKIIGTETEYGFWLRYVKKWSFGDILDFCKTAEQLPDKYNKTGFLVNKLCKRK